jgi:hypothetical protein
LSTTIAPLAFGERFALATFPDGGVVIDLVTGAYARLNLSATRILEALTTSVDLKSAGRLVETRLGMDDKEAARAIEEIVVALETQGQRRDRPDPFRYASAPDNSGYVLSSNGSPKLWLSSDGLVVRAVSPVQSNVALATEYLRAAAPKLLYLQGAAVLHAAACRGTNGLIVFCGDSGAGKTTTARAFSAAGANLFSEDMLVVASVSPLSVHFLGEEAIRKWALGAANDLGRTPQIDGSALRTAFDGPAAVVTEMWFIAAEQRVEGSNHILPRRLGATDAALAVMSCIFLGATSPSEWRRFLGLASTIATATSIFEARMPLGLDRLTDAAKVYTQNSAS